MTSLVRFSVKNRVLIVLLWVIFCIVGVQQAFELPIDVVPDVTNVQVQVITDSPGYATEEVERLVIITCPEANVWETPITLTCSTA